MITCDMQGGLGNILFQISAAYALAKRNNDECYFDLSQQIKCVTRHFDNLSEYKPNIFSRVNDQKIKNHDNNYTETHFHYNNIPYSENLFIHGHFQSEKYFSDYKDDISQLFRPTQEIDQYIQNKYGTLLSNDTVSLHCRRGDYITHKDIHYIQNKNYFEQSLSTFNNKTILIFSDDIEWCKSNINFENCHYIENEYDYIDLFLMSKCKDNIICNSTFSWWGAWLNDNKNKTVIAPKKWFTQPTHDIKDLYPSNWRTI